MVDDYAGRVAWRDWTSCTLRHNFFRGYNTEASERVAYDAKDERIRYQETPLGERQEVAGTDASERQLTGIINLDDNFKAARSVDRLSSLDPKEPVAAFSG